MRNNDSETATRKRSSQGWVLYDGECQFCLNIVERFNAHVCIAIIFRLAPLQAPWVQRRLGLKPGEPLVEMKLLAVDGTIYGGADALVRIARTNLVGVACICRWRRIPVAMILFRAIYPPDRRKPVLSEWNVSRPETIGSPSHRSEHFLKCHETANFNLASIARRRWSGGI